MTRISNCSLGGYGSAYYAAAIYYEAADVSLVTNCYMGGPGTCNVYINPSQQTTGIKISDCWLDADQFRNITANIIIMGSHSYYGLFTIVGNTFQGAYSSLHVYNGVYVEPSCGVRDVMIEGNMFFNHGYQAIRILGGTNYNICNNRVMGASAASPGNYDGINVDYGVDYLVINGNTVGHSYTSTSSTMRYGISIGNSGSSDYVMVTSNLLTGCVSGSGIYPNSITNKVILANLPDLTGY
jgi:hypothetical protein